MEQTANAARGQSPRMMATFADFLNWTGTFTVTADRHGGPAVHKRVTVRLDAGKIYLSPPGFRSSLLSLNEYQVTSLHEGTFTLKPTTPKSTTSLTLARELV
jgi:hypothetical protein